MVTLTEIWPLWLLLILPVMVIGLMTTLTDRTPTKRLVSFALRGLAVVLLVLGLCRPTTPQDTDRLHTVFVVDVSASVDLASARAALGSIKQAIEVFETNDSYSLLAVGSALRGFDNVEEFDDTLGLWEAGAADDRFRAGTDLPMALRAARLTLPDDASGRLVLFTDARPTTQGLGDALEQLDRQGIEVFTQPLAALAVPEIAVSGLTASPAFAHEGEVVKLTAEVAGNRNTSTELRIVHRGVIVARRDVQVVANQPQRVEVNLPMLTPGRTVWTAEIAAKPPGLIAQTDNESGREIKTTPAPSDHFVINNAISTTVHVAGRPRILVLHEKPREMRAFANAMEKQDLVIEVRPAEGAPRSLDRLLAFDAVVLANVAATDLAPAQLDMFKRFVTDFGGGLAMMGSENSFGLGGYYRTAVEEVLPLSSRFEQEKEKPSMAMVLVIDKSGSMSGMPIALARQAAKAAVELLGPQDQVGVVGFDGQAFIAAPLQPASDREGIKSAIDGIGAGGGTFMYAGMDAARQMLENAPARIKHMIVLGDGMSQPADHAGLAQQLVDMGVTISTVALGGGADQSLMSQIAEIGRGRYYLTMDPASVPQIFTRETMQASRSAIKEDLFAAVRVGDHPMLAGYSNTELPFTLGYVMTRARPTAQVLLTTDTGDPLLAINPFGLGQGMAFTGDLTPRWGGEWIAWSGFGKFWAQSMRALVRRPNTDSLEVQSTVTDRGLRIDLTEPAAVSNAFTEAATTATPWTAEVLDDAGRSDTIEVRPVGVGRYTASLDLDKSQRLTVRLHDPVGNQLRVLQYDRPYPAEYMLSARAAPEINALPQFVPELIRHNLISKQTSASITPWLLLLAIVSLTAGVLVRRV